MYRVLLVDDDPHILDTNERFLRRKGYEVIRSGDAESALEIASSAALDAIVLDVDLPGLDGVSACRRLREVSRVPVIFLSAYNRDDDRIRGLLAGGDDYLGKPYSLTELELRLRLRIERRLHVEIADVLRFDDLEIDLGLREVRYQGRAADFSVLEFDLLAFLARHPGQVFSYEQLYDRVWRSPINKSLHNLQMCIARVRQKLELLCPERHYIETIRRKGYRFSADRTEA
ncbi:MAG: response regulator transcription factor [Oscillospiraceae bacterium]|nr:response regulator transcription factor [Oscillospiraceae bacterium]